MQTTNEIAKEKVARLLKKGPGSILSSPGVPTHDQSRRGSRREGSISTVSYVGDPGSSGFGRKYNYENTYQLEPKKRFPSNQVYMVIKDVIDSYLGNEAYNPDLCRRMTKTLSEVIRSRVKNLPLPRYKIVCLINIGQLSDQTMTVASRCLWDASRDQSATYEFRNNSLFAVCTVYGVYFE